MQVDVYYEMVFELNNDSWLVTDTVIIRTNKEKAEEALDLYKLSLIGKLYKFAHDNCIDLRNSDGFYLADLRVYRITAIEVRVEMQ